MRLPRSILIRGRKFSIFRTREPGAWFHVQEQWIKVGRGRNPCEDWEFLVHEIDEILLCMEDVRYMPEYGDDPVFFMTHQAFQRISIDRAHVLLQLKKYIPER